MWEKLEWDRGRDHVRAQILELNREAERQRRRDDLAYTGLLIGEEHQWGSLPLSVHQEVDTLPLREEMVELQLQYRSLSSLVDQRVGTHLYGGNEVALMDGAGWDESLTWDIKRDGRKRMAQRLRLKLRKLEERADQLGRYTIKEVI